MPLVVALRGYRFGASRCFPHSLASSHSLLSRKSKVHLLQCCPSTC